MKILNPIKEIQYPAQEFQYVNSSGKSYFNIRLETVRKGFEQEYNYLRRPDLEHILLERSKELSISVSYNTQVVEIEEKPDLTTVTLQNGEINSYDLVVGADAYIQVSEKWFLARNNNQPPLRLQHSRILDRISR